MLRKRGFGQERVSLRECRGFDGAKCLALVAEPMDMSPRAAGFTHADNVSSNRVHVTTAAREIPYGIGAKVMIDGSKLVVCVCHETWC